MNNPINDGGPVHPQQPQYKAASDTGMTKREEYAKAAMAGILAGFWANPSLSDMPPEKAASKAVANADALIAALGEGQIVPERRIFYIDVGDMPADQAMSHVEQVIAATRSALDGSVTPK